MDSRRAIRSLTPSYITSGSMSSGYTHPPSTANKRRRSVPRFGQVDLPNHDTCAVGAVVAGETIALVLWEMEESTLVSI